MTALRIGLVVNPVAGLGGVLGLAIVFGQISCHPSGGRDRHLLPVSIASGKVSSDQFDPGERFDLVEYDRKGDL